jgi:hypothetical protein
MPAELDQLIDRLRIALESRLDGSVSRVPHPSRDAGRLRAPPDAVPEEDSLDPAADDDPPASQGLAHSSSSYSEATPTPERPKTSDEVTGGDCTETQQRSAELELPIE